MDECKQAGDLLHKQSQSTEMNHSIQAMECATLQVRDIQPSGKQRAEKTSNWEPGPAYPSLSPFLLRRLLEVTLCTQRLSEGCYSTKEKQ